MYKKDCLLVGEIIAIADGMFYERTLELPIGWMLTAIYLVVSIGVLENTNLETIAA